MKLVSLGGNAPLANFPSYSRQRIYSPPTGTKDIKLVAAIGNAPICSALQADANLSQLSSHLKFMVFGATRETSHRSVANPLCFHFNTLLHWQLLAERRILRTLGLLWSSLVMNRCCYVSTIQSYLSLSTSFSNYLENRFRCKDG